MANLEQWVNDRLHDILGLSDRYVSQFMIGTARKAQTAQDFVARLEQTGTIDVDQSVIAFAQELFDKIPGKPVVEKASRAIEREAIEMDRKNRTYTLLEDSDSDGDTVQDKQKGKRKSKDRGDRRKHIRKKKNNESSSEDEVPKRGSSSQSMKKEEEEEEEWEKEERERLQDIEERDAFAERVRQKDKEKTRNIAERTDKKAYEEAQKRLKMAEEDQNKMVGALS